MIRSSLNLCLWFLQSDYLVYTAETRAQTKQLIQRLENVPSLALVDLGLPPLPHNPDEGFELINELISYNPKMKILVLSGQSDKQNIQHALTLGAVDFIPKPCDIALFKSTSGASGDDSGGGTLSG